MNVLWFYFSYAGLFTLVDDDGWSWERAEKWLGDEAARALLRENNDLEQGARPTKPRERKKLPKKI